jgi:hypothetical protein
MAAVAIVVVLVIPIAVLMALLHVSSTLERRREQVVMRQIALTDAIHGVMGPVVAPIVRRGARGRWVGVLAIPPGYAEIGRMVQIAQATLGRAATIVLEPQDPAPVRRRRAASRRPLVLSDARPSR